MNTAFITHGDCQLHDMGAMHPECPQRLPAVQDQLIASGISDHLDHVEAPLATREQLERVHAPFYIDSVEEQSPRRGIVHLDPDTAMCPSSLQAALRAAGCEIEDMEISKADLEDVFVQIMRREGQMPGSLPNSAMEAAA